MYQFSNVVDVMYFYLPVSFICHYFIYINIPYFALLGVLNYFLLNELEFYQVIH